MLKQQMKEKGNPAGIKLTNVPRELSTLVRDVYKKMVDEEECEWNYAVSFDDQSNKDVNSSITRNVKAVAQDSQYDVSLIKRAARTYFKSRKSAHQRVQRGKQQSTSKAARRRQRKHNKAHARLKALNLSKSIDAERKEEIRAVLTVDFMSSDESEVDSVSTEHPDSSGSEDDREQQSSKKKLIRKKLSWRSQELQSVFDSLDRKLERRRSDRAKAMCLEIKVEGVSDRRQPDNAPEWAIELFS
ncbi:uncharacterized protein [Dysidea avara]|uniref:uncharacterized protein n=1 Tax=Dysidea avara TaxID=196820 RepID=UPI0033339122